MKMELPSFDLMTISKLLSKTPAIPERNHFYIEAGFASQHDNWFSMLKLRGQALVEDRFLELFLGRTFKKALSKSLT